LLVTLVIFIWGMSAYEEGNSMLIFNIELSEAIFIIVCILWFVFDAFTIYSAFTSMTNPKKYDSVIAKCLGNAELLLAMDSAVNATALIKTALALEIKQSVPAAKKSGGFASFNKLIALYQKLGMPAGEITDYQSGLDGFIERVPQSIKKQKDVRDFILGVENPSKDIATPAFLLGKDLLRFVNTLPAAESFAALTEPQSLLEQAEA
jgi:hypothetical protein